MAAIELKLHKYRSKGKWYFYAWRGGPRITGEPGTPEFMASYTDAAPDTLTDTGSPEYWQRRKALREGNGKREN